jgi:uncharacterized protein (TIGR03086 family)
MGIIETHEKALDQSGNIVDGVDRGQADLATPCTEWNVDALLKHMIGGNWMFATLSEGKPGEAKPATASGDGNPAHAYRESAGALKAAWRQPGALDKSYQLPFGELPGEAVLSAHTVELVAHGWDLAKATGQEAKYDPDVLETAAGFAHHAFPSPRAPGVPIAAEVPVPEDAPAVDRLAGFLGRKP